MRGFPKAEMRFGKRKPGQRILPLEQAIGKKRHPEITRAHRM